MVLELRWLACNLASGKLIEELVDLTPKGAIASILATYTSASFALPIATAPTEWEGAVQEGQAMIVALLSGKPIWAGAVLTCQAGSSPVAEIACVSLEGYLDRRFVGNHTWAQQDEASVIAAGLIGDANVEGLSFAIDAPATGTLRDRTYLDQDDKTVYSALRELMGVIDGPEWTIDLAWDDATQTVTKTARVRKRIGVATAMPNAVFDSRGSNSIEYSLLRDWSSGKGANHVVAVSSGQGESRPQSTPARDVRTGWARWEHRFTPSTSITDTAVLDSHAQKSLDLMGYGARTLTITAHVDAFPILGADWGIGDDVSYNLIGHAHPAGLTGIARAIGWQFDPVAETIEPILLLSAGSIGGI